MKKFLFVFLLGGAVGVAGTVYVFQAVLVAPPPSANVYGQFIGNVDSTWLDDGRRMQLNADITYVDPENKAWTAPSGSVVDGASIPTALWSVIGGPFEGKYRKASVLHDVACDEKKESSDDVHRMFYYACRSAGVDEKPMTEADARAIFEFVKTNNPKLSEIKKLKLENGRVRAALRRRERMER